MLKDVNAVKRSLFWASIEKAIQFLLSFFVTTILAREIGPAAFGLVALVIVFEFFFLYIMEAGLSQVIIQRKEIDSIEINTAFTFNVLLGTALTATFYFSANVLAVFFEQPLLSDIIKIMSIKIFVLSLSRIHVALLEKYFKFKRLALISSPVRLASGSIAVYLVYSGLGIWSYVYYNLTQAILLSLALFLFSGIKVKFDFSLQCLKKLLPLGVQFSATRLLNTLSEKLYYLVIGKYYNVSTLGLFQRADVIRRASAEEFATIINRVFLPFFSKQSNKSVDFIECFKKLAPFYCLFFFFSAVTVICLSDFLIDILLGAEWQQASVFLKFLAVLGFVNALNLFIAMIRKSTGSGKDLLNETILERILRLFLLFAFLKHGLILVIIGQIIGSFCAFSFRIFKLKDFLEVSFSKALKPFLLGLSLMAFSLIAFMLSIIYSPEYFNSIQARFLFLFLTTLFTLTAIKAFYYSEAIFVIDNILRKNK